MTDSKREHQDFHVGLKAFIERQGSLLILQDNEGLWELPGGRIEKTELHKNLEEPLGREVAEELGPAFQYEVGHVFHAWIRQPNSEKDFYIFLVGLRCEYKNGKITLSAEHKNFKWMEKNELERLEFENTYKEAVKYYFKMS